MGDLDQLYREVILDHFKNPRNPGTLTPADIKVEGVNPFCGDRIEITVRMKGDKVDDVKLTGNGCSISQSSGSMMTEALKGKNLEEAALAVGKFKDMMLAGGSPDNLPEEMEDVAALEGVKKYPVRIKCALLAWNTLLEGLKSYAAEKKPVVATHKEE
jgi:nitrogen fixation NifU-like protein